MSRFYSWRGCRGGRSLLFYNFETGDEGYGKGWSWTQIACFWIWKCSLVDTALKSLKLGFAFAMGDNGGEEIMYSVCRVLSHDPYTTDLVEISPGLLLNAFSE